MSTEYNGDEWVTPKEFAAWLKFDVKTVQRWCRDGTITAVRRIGHRRFIINKPQAWTELETAKQRRDQEQSDKPQASQGV